jgi:hypothetical protein
VGLLALDAGFLQRAVEHLSGRSDERFAGEVFLVAGLFADQHHLPSDPIGIAYEKHNLRS